MTWSPSPQEVDAVLRQLPKTRYSYFIKRAADREVLAGAESATDWLLLGDESSEMVPVWPHVDFANVVLDRLSPAHRGSVISLDEFLNDWLPSIAADNRLLLVFPDGDGNGVTRQPSELTRDLLAERAQFG